MDGNMDFWSTDKHAERLDHATPREAAADWLDSVWLPMPAAIRLNPTLTLYGWRRTKVTREMLGVTADDLVGFVSEQAGEWMDPDGAMESLPDMAALRDAADRFIEAYVGQFVAWRCEVAGTTTVHVPQLVADEWGAHSNAARRVEWRDS